VFLLAAPIVMFFLLLYARSKINISVKIFGTSYSKNSKIPVVIKIANNSIIPVSNAKFVIKYSNSLDNTSNTVSINTPIFQKNTQNLRLMISSKHCGILSAEIVKINLFDFLNLTSLKIGVSKKNKSNYSASVAILPEIFELDASAAHYVDSGLESEVFSKSKKGDDASEIFSIHEYADGDKISRIHWKISAKQDKTFVKDYSLPINNTIEIMIDMFNPFNPAVSFLEVYDNIIECATSASAFLVENDIPHKLCWYDKNIDGNNSMIVETYDDFLIFLNHILRTRNSSQPNTVVLEFLKDFENLNKKCAHLIFVTSHFDDKTYELLTKENLAIRYTVFLISKLEISDAYLKYDDVTIISVDSDNISNSIQNFCF